MNNSHEWMGMILGWLAKTSLDVAILVVLIFAIRAMFGKWISPRWMFALWLLVVARLLLPYSPSCLASVHNIWRQNNIATSWVMILQGGDNTLMSTSVENTAKKGGQLAMPDLSPAPVTTKTGWSAIVILTWVSGIIFLVGYTLFGNLRLTSRIAKTRPVTDSGVLELLEDAKEEMGVSAPVTLIFSPLVHTPMLMGWIRPRIILPEKARGLLSPDEMRHVLLHELAHLRRNDIPLNWIVTVASIIHWFNPLVWWGFRTMRVDREKATDARVLEIIGGGKEYGQTILKLIENWSAQEPIPGATGIFEEKLQLQERLRSIISGRSRTQGGWVAFAAALLLAASTFTAATKETSLSAGEAKEGIIQELDKARIPQLRFVNADLNQVLEFFKQWYRQENQGKEGINFVCEPGVLEKASPITLTLDDISISAAIQYAFELSGVGAKVDGNAIVVMNSPGSFGSSKGDVRTINSKMQSVVFPRVYLNEVDLDNAVSFLTEQSRALSKDKKAVNFVIMPGVRQAALPINLDMTNVSLSDLVKYIATSANIRYKIEPEAIVFLPSQE